MKTKLSYFILSFTLVFIGLVAWKYATANPKEDSVQVQEKSPHGLHEHGHQEESVIVMPLEQIKELGIQTMLAGPGELSVTISTRGKVTLHPDRLVHVLPKIAGVAEKAWKNIGDTVEEGDILAVLESREMADSKASYLAANEKLTLASSLLEREKRLHEKKVSAEQDYLNAKAVYQEAKISAQLAKQKLYAFGVTEEEITKLTHAEDPDLKHYEIRSPMKGTVIARHITQGEFIENTTTIYEIADLSTVWIEIGIYPKDLMEVQKGQLVDIFLPDGTTSAAKIIYLSPIIQDETITAKAVAELRNPHENWRPGSFVKVNIATDNVTAPLVIPKEAYQEIEGQEFVFVKVPEGFEKRQVQLGVSNDTSIEVLSGLKPGEEYASSKTFLLKADISKKEAEHEH